MGVWKSALLVLGTAIAVLWLPGQLLQKPRSTEIGGFVAPGWEAVERAFRRCVESGAHLGGGFAVYHRGQLVVNLYSGNADDEAAVKWRENTLTNYYSATKAVGAILIAVLVDRGLLNYDEPVVKYWPEFAQKGKEKVTVRQLLSHQAGLIYFDEPISAYKLYDDPDAVFSRAAAATPKWKLGEGIGYHGFTIGIYMDALIRRVDPQHRNITQFYEDEIRKPYDIDFYIGLPRTEHYRAARYYTMTPGRLLKGLFENYQLFSVYLNYLMGSDDNFGKVLETLFPDKNINVNNPNYRELPIASGLGFGTPQGMAKIWGLVANSGVDNNIMNEETARVLAQPVSVGVDKVLGVDVTYGVGTNLHPNPKGVLLAGHPGAGGQMGYMDIDRALGWGYCTNHEAFGFIHETYAALLNALYESVESIEK